jgi:hypothetical protein
MIKKYYTLNKDIYNLKDIQCINIKTGTQLF